MGSYYSIATRIRVKENAPAELIAIMDDLFSWTIDATRNVPEEWKDLNSYFGHNACYLPKTEPKKEAIEGGWLYSHTGSARHCPEDELIPFLRKYREWFIADAFDIVCRAVYEDGFTETTVYYNGSTFVSGYGYIFEDPYKCKPGHRIEHVHPDNAHIGDDYEEFDTHGFETLPWNYKEVLKLNVKSGRKHYMGSYTAVATRLKIKKTFDEGGLAFFMSLYKHEDDLPDEMRKQVEPLIEIIQGNGGTGYYPGWRWSYVEDCGDHWLMESRASTSRVQSITENFCKLAQDMASQMVLEKGDIVLRAVYEEAAREHIVYFDGEKMVVGTGFVYAYDGMPGIVSYAHPSNAVEPGSVFDEKEIAAAEAEVIPWNLAQVEELNKASYAEYAEDLRRNSFGGGL